MPFPRWEAYGLRSRAGNFDFAEMKKPLILPMHNAKYIAANMTVTHTKATKRSGEFFRTVRDIGIDAAIISDMALMDICASEAPGLPIHLSTQSSAANYETLNFWKDEGLERVVLAREVSMDEIKVQKKSGCRNRAFIHGAMPYFLFRPGVLSNHMVHRDANRGGCAQSCRWKYGLFDMPFAGERIWSVLAKKESKRNSR